jgi:tetratricopeptide (TPR) repeat protein
MTGMKSAKLGYAIFLWLSVWAGFVIGQTGGTGQTTAVSSSFRKKLDSLRKANNLGDWLYARVDYSYSAPRQTLSFLTATEKEAWRKPVSAAEKEAWLIMLSNLGYNQLYAGDILASINSYEKAYNFWTDNKLNTEITDYVLKPWANNYTRLGDYEKALFIQQKILDFALRDHNDDLAASAYNNMAISYRSVGDYERAEAFIQNGLKKTTALNTTILLNNTLADVYKDRNELDLAAQVIRANIARQQQRIPDFDTAYWLLSSYTTAGDVELAKHQYTAAAEYYHLGLKINDQYYKGNRLREKAYLVTQLGRIKLADHKAQEALVYFNQNLDAFGLLNENLTVNKEKIFGDNRIIDVFYQKAQAYIMLGKEKEALENVMFSLASADKIRFELADVKTRQRFQAETKQKAEMAIDLAFSLLGRTKAYHYATLITDIAEQSKARTLLDEIRRNQQRMTLRIHDSLFTYSQMLEKAIVYNEKEMLQNPGEIKSLDSKNAGLKFKLEAAEKKLKEKYPALNRVGNNEPVSSGLLNRLPASVHLIEYFLGIDNIYAIEIKNRRIVHIHKITGSASIKKNIGDFSQTYYHKGPAAMMNNPQKFFKASYTVYKNLVGPLKINNAEKLTIIPDELTGYLSFDGLITDSNYVSSISAWPFFIKKASLSYAFSVQTLLNQAVRKSSGKEFNGFFITHQGTARQYIPAVEKEAEAIKAEVSGEFLMDKDASVKHFFEAFDHSAVLHIGTHAYLSGKQQEPALALDDDQVFLFELSARKNSPALVTLSACRTADGMMAAGEGIISLSRGFAAIGTQGTIAGLWNVNDDAASEITAGCYRYMLEKKPVATALHLSKLDWLSGRHNSELEYLPYYWGALVYMGYDQVLDLKPANPYSGTLILTGAALALLLLIFLVLKLRRPKAGRQ